ncbi:MAG: PIG-L deacetylase family protein [Armatimonadota bacterium]
MDFERVMVFGAHPDDEVTMSGTIAKMADRGVRVVVVNMTNGSEGYPRLDMRDKIVEMRAQEAAECDQVLGIARRVILDVEDMGLVNDKATVQECIRLIREEKPEAVFTHGPVDRHRDHRNTHAISVDARWHAGEPVAAALGEPWYPRHMYYYKGVVEGLPQIHYDVTGYAHKRYEAQATQVSQHTLWGRTGDEFLAGAERVKNEGGPATEVFWIAETERLHDFIPKDL